jgi:hypothetical protein
MTNFGAEWISKILELDIDFPEIVMNFEYKFKGRMPKFLLTLHLEEYEKKNKK